LDYGTGHTGSIGVSGGHLIQFMELTGDRNLIQIRFMIVRRNGAVIAKNVLQAFADRIPGPVRACLSAISD